MTYRLTSVIALLGDAVEPGQSASVSAKVFEPECDYREIGKGRGDDKAN
jgi:hypothetical protein